MKIQKYKAKRKYDGVEIEVYASEVTPDLCAPICFYSNGRWLIGEYRGVFFHGNDMHAITRDYVDLWFYLPERDIFE